MDNTGAKYLGIRDHDDVKGPYCRHYKIMKNAADKLYIYENQLFLTLEDLIKHYSGITLCFPQLT